MSDTRAHAATPRRLARARDQFGRPSSGELAAACAVGIVALGLPSLTAAFAQIESVLWDAALQAARAPQLSVAQAVAAQVAPLRDLAQLSAAAFGALALAAGVAIWLQRGMFARFVASAGAGSELGLPREGWTARASRALFTSAKWLVLIALLLSPWLDALRGMLGVWQRASSELAPLLSRLGVRFFERGALALLALGALDFGVQQLAFRRRLRMSRRELQDEHRATEAAPQAGDERRRRAEERVQSATLLEVDSLSAVVCDLEGRAIGLRGLHAPERPVVWIKAERGLAARLRAAASARALPIAIDSELLDALGAFELGEALPARLVVALRARAAQERP